MEDNSPKLKAWSSLHSWETAPRSLCLSLPPTLPPSLSPFPFHSLSLHIGCTKSLPQQFFLHCWIGVLKDLSSSCSPRHVTFCLPPKSQKPLLLSWGKCISVKGWLQDNNLKRIITAHFRLATMGCFVVSSGGGIDMGSRVTMSWRDKKMAGANRLTGGWKEDKTMAQKSKWDVWWLILLTLTGSRII